MSGKGSGRRRYQGGGGGGVEWVKAEVELPEYTVALELLLNTREYAVLKDSMSFTMVKRHQSIK